MLPTSQNTFTAARFLSLANAQMRSKIIPLVDRVQEGYYEYDVDTAINATGTYNIHTRAVGGKLLDLALINGDDRYPLARYYDNQLQNLDSSPGNLGYRLKRSQIILVPYVPGGWTYLRQTILLRPPTFVAVTDAAQVTGINTLTGVVTCSTVPSTWTTASILDIVQAEPHFDALGIDLAISAVTTGVSGSVTFSPSALPSRLAVGDWVSLAGQSPVIQCPVELQPLLAQEVANICLRGQTDPTAYKMGVEEAKELKEGLMALINPRVKKEGKKLVNMTGLLRRGM
jgi:hypothetical protein